MWAWFPRRGQQQGAEAGGVCRLRNMPIYPTGKEKPLPDFKPRTTCSDIRFMCFREALTLLWSSGFFSPLDKVVPLSRRIAFVTSHIEPYLSGNSNLASVPHTLSSSPAHTHSVAVCLRPSQETWEGKPARQVKSHRCGHNVLMLVAWEAVNFPFPAVSASDSRPWNGAANVLFITDIGQMALGRMEMDSPSIFPVFHYTDLLTRLLILKKTRDIVCIWE